MAATGHEVVTSADMPRCCLTTSQQVAEMAELTRFSAEELCLGQRLSLGFEMIKPQMFVIKCFKQ